MNGIFIHLLHSHGPTEVGHNLLIYFIAVTNKEKDTTDADNFTINSKLSTHGYYTLRNTIVIAQSAYHRLSIHAVFVNTSNSRAGGRTLTVQEEE